MAVKKVKRTIEEKLLQDNAINKALKEYEERPVLYGTNSITESQLESVLDGASLKQGTSYSGNSETSKLDILYKYICNFRRFDKASRLVIRKLNKKYAAIDLKLMFNKGGQSC